MTTEPPSEFLLKVFVEEMLRANTRERSTWVHTRLGDLDRLMAGLQVAVHRVADGKAEIAELEGAIARLTQRLEHVRARLAALDAARQAKSATPG